MARRRKVIDDSDIDSSSASDDLDDPDEFQPGYDPDREAEQELFRDLYQRGKRRRKRRRGEEDDFDAKEDAIYGVLAHASDDEGERQRGRGRGGRSRGRGGASSSARLHKPQAFVLASSKQATNPLEDPQPLADVDAFAENDDATMDISASSSSDSDGSDVEDEEIAPVEDAQPPPAASSSTPGLGAAATSRTGLGAGPRVGLGASSASSAATANYAAAKIFAKGGVEEKDESPAAGLGAKTGLGAGGSPRAGLGGGGLGSGLGHKSVRQLMEDSAPASAASSDSEGLSAAPPRRSFLGATPSPASTPQQTKAKPFLSKDEQRHFTGLAASSSIGHKLLAKMGWASGSGLGAKGEGIVTPIESKLRPKGAGLAYGGFGERTKQAKDEDRRQGKAVSSDEEEAGFGRRRGKGKVRASLDSTRQGTPTSDASAQRPPVWKRAAKVKKPKIIHKTYEEILASQGVGTPGVDSGVGQIVDLTGQELPSLSTTLTNANITAPTDEDRKTLPELRHNLKLLCDMAKAEVQGLAREGKALEERKRYIAEERRRLEAEKGKREAERRRSDAVSKAVREVGEVARRVGGEDREVEEVLQEIEDVCEKVVEAAGGDDAYDRLRLDEVAIAASAPILRRAWTTWQPLEDPTFLVARLKRWRRLFRLQNDVATSQAQDVDVFGSLAPRAIANGHVNATSRTMTAYETLLWTLWLPRIRSTVNLWSPADAVPLVEVFVAWRPLLPQFLVDNILDQLILPKVSSAIAEWSPRKADAPQLHTIVFPWLEHAGEARMDDVLDQAKRRIRSWLNSWRPKDGVPKGLAVWREVFSKKDWDSLMLKTIVPALGAYLRDNFDVNPRNQDMVPLERTLPWRGLLRSSIFTQLLQSGFFTKWLDALWVWLTHSPDYDQVNQWYGWWKAQALPEDMQRMRAVEDGFARGVELIHQARSLLSLGMSVKDKLPRPDLEKRPLGASSRSSTPTPASTPGAGAKTSKPAVPSRQAEEVTFRSIVEEEAAKENLIVMPTGRSREATGAALLRVSRNVDGRGGVTIYIEDDVVYVQDGDEWEPMMVEDMLARAKG